MGLEKSAEDEVNQEMATFNHGRDYDVLEKDSLKKAAITGLTALALGTFVFAVRHSGYSEKRQERENGEYMERLREAGL